jgi:hypothetical protein
MPYLNVIAEKLGEVVHILDRFHVMQHSARRWTRSVRTSRSGWCGTAMSQS